MFYVLNDDNKIAIADNSFERIQATVDMMPALAGKDILETDKEIVNYNGKFYFTDDEEYIAEKAKDDAEKLAMLSLTKREVFLALYRDKGVTPEQIKSQITDPEALIEFEYATEYYRGNPLINQIGAMLGYTVDELDYLFIHKELPSNEEV